MRTEKTLSSRSAYEGDIVRVRVDRVDLPSGRTVAREIVEHSDAVVIVPIDDDSNVILVRQYRHAADQALLEAPAGGIDEAESPEDCAQRELREETGYLSRDLRPLPGFWVAPGYCTEFMHAFVARDLEPDSLEPDEDEDIQVERVRMAQIPGLIRSGEIRDGKTIAALLMVTSGYEASQETAHLVEPE